MYVTTTHASCTILLSPLRVSREIHECYIRDFHERSTGIRTIVTVILTYVWPNRGSLDEEVLKADVLHDAPKSTSGTVLRRMKD
jgi:hypothetical protein